ncbi:MAG: hypothetical protein QOD11_829 [Bradyrhizobium sp.]|jgi:hypothetical protein|nr:hypothetical protein [Bradyrhizobium sp.]
MHSYVPNRPPLQNARGNTGAAEQAGTHVALRSPAPESAGAKPLNETPQSQSLLQMRHALDEGPRVQSQLTLQRALNRHWTGPEPTPAASHAVWQGQDRVKPALQMKGVAINADALGPAVQLKRNQLSPKQARNRERWMTRHAERNVRETERMNAEAKRNIVAPGNINLAPTAVTDAAQTSASVSSHNDIYYVNNSEVKVGDTNAMVLADAHQSINYAENHSNNNTAASAGMGAQPVNRSDTVPLPKERLDEKELALRQAAIAKKTPWRRWNSETNEAELKDHVPESTFNLPQQMVHVTDYRALRSIRESGLDPKYAKEGTSTSGLNARAVADGDTKYRDRDKELQAVYLGSHAGVGTSMESPDQTAAGGRVAIHINFTKEFLYNHVRAAPAVLGTQQNSTQVFDDINVAPPRPKATHKLGSIPKGKNYIAPASKPQPPVERPPDITAMSFATIPADSMSIFDPESKTFKNLSTDFKHIKDLKDAPGMNKKEDDQFLPFATKPKDEDEEDYESSDD